MSRSIDRRDVRARRFRQNPTEAERKLWQGLQKLPRDSSHMRRQAPIGPYFADFACHTNRIVIEIDGGQHAESKADLVRTAYLRKQGYRVLRFWNNDVLNNMDGVLEAILIAFRTTPPTPKPSPPHARGVGN
jgi:very-short-patch-repair endonuclease